MKTVIYWFSGTGNSLAVAKALAGRFEDVELVSISRAFGRPVPDADRIGLVFPVYGWGPPAIVSRFVQTLSASSGTSVFAVVTYAAMKGGTLDTLRRMLQGRGLDLAAGWGVKMPENYPPLGGAPAVEKQQAIHQAAAKQLEAIADHLNGLSLESYKPSPLVLRLLSRMIYPLFSRHVKKADRSFCADEKCNGCEVCSQVCPVGNILMKDGFPEWQGHCEQCFACFHWCPHRAIQFGRSMNQVRYHHPAVQLAELVR